MIALVFSTVPLYVRVPLGVPLIEVVVPFARRTLFDVKFVTVTPGPIGPVLPV